MPETVFHAGGEVIIATQTISRGPGTFSAGIYAFSMETGQALWTNHCPAGLRQGPYPITLKAGEDWEGPRLIRERRLITTTGRLLDLFTGEEEGSLPQKEIHRLELEEMERLPPDIRFYSSGEISLEGGRRLCLGSPAKAAQYRVIRKFLPAGMLGPRPGFGRGAPFKLCCLDREKAAQWTFQLDPQQQWMDSNCFAMRLMGDSLLFVCAHLEPHHELSPEGMIVQPALFSLYRLDLQTGRIVTRTQLGHEPLELARIEDHGEDELLISLRTHQSARLMLFSIEG